MGMRPLVLALLLRHVAAFVAVYASATRPSAPAAGLLATASNASAVGCTPRVRGEPWPPVLRRPYALHRRPARSDTPGSSPARGRKVFPLQRTDTFAHLSTSGIMRLRTPGARMSQFARADAAAFQGLVNTTTLVHSEISELRARMADYEALLEDLLFALTDSDDLALLERDAARTYIVSETLTKDRPARLLRTTLLALMRQHAIPLPKSAPLDPNA
jgi:hypothetical protein